MLIRGDGVTLEQLKAVFLTRMHQDHFGGLPDMVKFRINRFRVKDLQIFLSESAAMETFFTFTDCRIIPMPQVSRKNNAILSKKTFFLLTKRIIRIYCIRISFLFHCSFRQHQTEMEQTEYKCRLKIA